MASLKNVLFCDQMKPNYFFHSNKMGGCNSVFNQLSSLAGGFTGIGLGIARGDLNDPAKLALDAVGGGASLFAQKNGCDKSKTALIKATQEIVATAIVTSLNQCNAAADSAQNIIIKCDPVIPPNLGYDVYEGNPACGQCNSSVFTGMLKQHEMERKMWESGPAQVRLPINQEFILLIGRLGTCGTVTCKACALANVSQVNIIDSKNECYQTLTNENVFKTNLNTLVNQQLLSNQDILAGVAQAFGKNDSEKISEDITNFISSNVDTTFLNNIATNVQSQQTIQVTGQSTFSNNVSQYSVFNSALDAVIQEQIIERSISDAMFTLIEQVANQQNTLSSVGEILFTSTITFVAAVNNVVGQVLIATLAALGVVVLFILGFTLYKVIKKVTLSSIELEKKNELKQTSLSGLQQF